MVFEGVMIQNGMYLYFLYARMLDLEHFAYKGTTKNAHTQAKRAFF